MSLKFREEMERQASRVVVARAALSERLGDDFRALSASQQITLAMQLVCMNELAGELENICSAVNHIECGGS